MKNDYKEKPFEYLRHKDGTEYKTEVITNWYLARDFVLDRLKDVAFIPGSNEHLHVVVDADDELMLAVVRQVALSAHYINYVEYDVYGELKCKNRTVITLISNNENIIDDLCAEEYLYKLMEYCKYRYKDGDVNPDSYIDVELEIVGTETTIDDNNAIWLKKSDVENHIASRLQEDMCCIDTRKAVWASRMYDLGDLIGNLPAEDIHCTHRYTLALEAFYHKLLQDEWTPLVNEKGWTRCPNDVKKDLSNVFCADCFETRELAIRRYSKEKGISEAEAWEKNNEALSMSEHERWVVEKLIMGYRPLNNEEHIHDERLFGDIRKQYRKELKNNTKEDGTPHIDLCSYRELRRVNPDDMKYDSFLMLAIPKILEKVKEGK